MNQIDVWGCTHPLDIPEDKKRPEIEQCEQSRLFEPQMEGQLTLETEDE